MTFIKEVLNDLRLFSYVVGWVGNPRLLEREVCTVSTDEQRTKDKRVNAVLVGSESPWSTGPDLLPKYYE